MKRIIMTGGGTSGHVTPNMALIPHLQNLGYEIHYLGTQTGIERGLIEDLAIPYHVIKAGKLRRYLSVENFKDILRVIGGFRDAFSIMRNLKPDLVFSKGGFVASPVVWAAYLNRIPVIIHESDMTPGLANKLSMPFATKICYTFPETEKHISSIKGVFTGLPVREMLLSGDPEVGRNLCGFIKNKPIIVVIGGSQGSEVINSMIRETLNTLLKDYQVCHICGKDGIDQSLQDVKGYIQYEYVKDELAHLFAMANLVISRAGATVIFELLALKKPNLLIPLSKRVSRGDQILNAYSFEKQGFSLVLEEEEMTGGTFLQKIQQCYGQKAQMVKAMKTSDFGQGVKNVLTIIQDLTSTE